MGRGITRCRDALTQGWPWQEENIVNRLQRQIEGLMANYKALESGLEARGIAVKDIITPSIESKTTEWVYGRSPTRSDGRLSGRWPDCHSNKCLFVVWSAR